MMHVSDEREDDARAIDDDVYAVVHVSADGSVCVTRRHEPDDTRELLEMLALVARVSGALRRRLARETHH
jgi:hypothetical protein